MFIFNFIVGRHTVYIAAYFYLICLLDIFLLAVVCKREMVSEQQLGIEEIREYVTKYDFSGCNNEVNQ